MPGKRLLVDACVARSAGNKSHAPQSRFSREALIAIRENRDHSLVFNTPLMREWNEHATRLARSILTSMFQKKRVIYVADDAFSAVIRRCALSLTDPVERVAFEKDGHVTAGALAADKIIISNETRLRNYLLRLSATEPMLCLLQWCNPSTEEMECILWIKNGSPSDVARLIQQQKV